MSSTSSRRVVPKRDDLDRFARFCATHLTLEDGVPLEVHDFQRRMLGDLFDGRRETVILIPKKNGKSTLLGALALYHTVTTPDAECVIAAASRDQAQIMLRQAQGFIRRSQWLQDRLQVKQREIVHKTLNGRIRVLASDVDTADGVIPTLALVDELHRHKSADLYGIFRDGLGPRDGQMVTISTAGDDHESPLGQLRRTAHSQPGVVRDGAYLYVSTPGFALHEWALGPDDDRDDLGLVKGANPAPWQTVEALRQRKESPSMVPWQWARFACGVWISGEGAAVSEKEWREAADPTVKIPDGVDPVVGIDIGRKVDCTAVVAVWKPPEGPIVVEPLAILVPAGDGTSIPEEQIWGPIVEAATRWPRATFLADPKLGGDLFIERIDREFPSCTTAVFDQVPQALARMAGQFTEELGAGRLAHPDDEALNAHVLSAASRPVGEGWRFVKQRKKQLPIDGLIALCMALSVLLGANNEPEYARAQW